MWTTLSLTFFYGGSTYAALANRRYADFFTEHVPLGSKIVDFVEDTPVGQKIKSTNASEMATQAVEVASSGYDRVSGAIGRVVGEAKDKVDSLQSGSKEILESDTVQQTRTKASDLVRKVERKAKDSGVEDKIQDAAQDLKSKSRELVDQAKAAANQAEKKVESKGDEAKATLKNVASKAEGKTLQPYGQALPLQHEAPEGYAGSSFRDRGVKADTEHSGRLRDPPSLPSLPRLAPSLSSLSGSEPMIAQLAGTIDDLAAFLRDAPAQAGSKASGVLDDAKRELSRLYERLEHVKKTEADKLHRELESQKAKYDAALKKAADEAEAKMGKADEAFAKKQDELRKREAAEYTTKLKAELQTQSEIINERLKEEVVQQGVEMQRRWMKEIKARVEAERGGRLAKLDELAKDLDHIQKLSLDNSQALEDGASALALNAALRELSQAALDESIEAGTKRSFARELERVQKAASSKEQNALLTTTIEKLRAERPEEGVESFSSLYAWFAQKVRPAVQKVALVPDQAGVLNHLVSAAIAPLLFSKSGYPQDGDDVPSVLARTQYLLERRDLDGAARQLNQLKGWPKILVEDWLQAARRRLEVEQHLEVSKVCIA